MHFTRSLAPRLHELTASAEALRRFTVMVEEQALRDLRPSLNSCEFSEADEGSLVKRASGLDEARRVENGIDMNTGMKTIVPIEPLLGSILGRLFACEKEAFVFAVLAARSGHWNGGRRRRVR